MYIGTRTYGTFVCPGATGAGGVLPVCGETAGLSGRQNRSGVFPGAGAGTLAQSINEPSACCVVDVRYGLFEEIELGRPVFGLTTHWIQSDSFLACAQLPCTYQFA